jgi:hypothetical protein
MSVSDGQGGEATDDLDETVYPSMKFCPQWRLSRSSSVLPPQVAGTGTHLLLETLLHPRSDEPDKRNLRHLRNQLESPQLRLSYPSWSVLGLVEANEEKEFEEEAGEEEESNRVGFFHFESFHADVGEDRGEECCGPHVVSIGRDIMEGTND